MSDPLVSPESAPGVHARLLFIGDIHLGRRPSRLSAALVEQGLDPAQLGPAAAWRRSVACALAASARGELDAVVLAGDVVESLEDRFEAFAPLADGVQQLVEAGVPVLGVAGNHDGLALPRLAQQIPGFTLLGAGGRWERRVLETRSGARVALLGWSFPSRRVRESPVAQLRASWSDGVPTLGVLHCDLDGGRSDYAPVTRAELEHAPVAAWLLGHVHAPGDLSGTRPIGYLGSLVGLDPGEPGERGPCWVELLAQGEVRARPHPLAPLRWERVHVDAGVLDEAGDSESARDALFAALRGALAVARARCAAAPEPVLAVGCRVRLTGSTRRRDLIHRLVSDPTAWPTESRAGLLAFVEKVEDDTRPARDLEELARHSDPPGLAARRLLALERNDPATRGWLREAARRLHAQRLDPRWTGLDDGPELDAEPGDPELEDTRQRLVRVARDLVDALLEQREGAEERG